MKRLIAGVIVALTIGAVRVDAQSSTDYDERLVKATVDAWLVAWQGGDLEEYIAFYGPEFQAAGFDYRGWRKKKKAVLAGSSNIKVEIGGLDISVSGTRATARFGQRYSSSRLKDQGMKTLIFKRARDGRWFIVSEVWSKSNRWPSTPPKRAKATPPRPTPTPPPKVARLPQTKPSAPEPKPTPKPTPARPRPTPAPTVVPVQHPEIEYVNMTGDGGSRTSFGAHYAYLRNAEDLTFEKGGGARFSFGLSDSISVVLDGSYHKEDLDRMYVLGGFGVETSGSSRVRLFAHVLGGYTRISKDNFTNNGATVGAGAGFDVMLSDSFGLRLGQVDYLQSFMLDDFFEDGHTYDFRLSAGIVFRPGRH